MGIKLHASVSHRENVQMPVREVFAHQFRLPRRGEELAQFLILLCFRIARDFFDTLKTGEPPSGSPVFCGTQIMR